MRSSRWIPLGGVALFWMASAGGCGGSSDGGSSGGTCTDPEAPGAGWNLGLGTPDPAAALRAAVMIASCIPDDDPHGYLKDFYYERGDLYDSNPSSIACVAARNDACAAVRDCLGLESDSGGPCEPSCSGSVLQACDDSLRFRLDCAKRNMQCSSSEGCIPCHPGPACNKDTEDRCDGQVPVNCRDGHETPMADCGLLGLGCGIDEYGSARCAGKNGQCAANKGGEASIEAGVSCSGTKLTACVNDGLFEIDCGDVALGFGCQTLGQASFCGLAAECDPSLADPSCDGDALVMCNAGKLEKVDCASLGFAGCDAARARCAK
ncbi:MAG: hypothetical protein IPM35_11010 [Myxococcales bacterium]|nr:hypothetical protein [Myxococcales bacterium]